MLRYSAGMRCLILVLVSVSAFAGPAMGQRAPSREGGLEACAVHLYAVRGGGPARALLKHEEAVGARE
ncbi:MAG: hypothetical protein ACK5YG_09515, partial [Alphaproteobacteria bacterium]